jgi:hypothetical protein
MQEQHTSSTTKPDQSDQLAVAIVEQVITTAISNFLGNYSAKQPASPSTHSSKLNSTSSETTSDADQSLRDQAVHQAQMQYLQDTKSTSEAEIGSSNNLEGKISVAPTLESANPTPSVPFSSKDEEDNDSEESIQLSRYTDVFVSELIDLAVSRLTSSPSPASSSSLSSMRSFASPAASAPVASQSSEILAFSDVVVTDLLNDVVTQVILLTSFSAIAAANNDDDVPALISMMDSTSDTSSEDDDLTSEQATELVDEAIDRAVTTVAINIRNKPASRFPSSIPTIPTNNTYSLSPHQVLMFADSFVSELMDTLVTQFIAPQRPAIGSLPIIRDSLKSEVTLEDRKKATDFVDSAVSEAVVKSISATVTKSVTEAVTKAVADALARALPQLVSEAVNRAIAEYMQESMHIAIADATAAATIQTKGTPTLSTSSSDSFALPAKPMPPMQKFITESTDLTLSDKTITPRQRSLNELRPLLDQGSTKPAVTQLVHSMIQRWEEGQTRPELGRAPVDSDNDAKIGSKVDGLPSYRTPRGEADALPVFGFDADEGTGSLSSELALTMVHGLLERRENIKDRKSKRLDKDE